MNNMYVSLINDYQRNSLGKEYNLNIQNQEDYPISSFEEPDFQNLFQTNLSPKTQEKNIFNLDKSDNKEINNKNSIKIFDKNKIEEEIQFIEIKKEKIDFNKLKRLNKYGEVISSNNNNSILKPKFLVIKNTKDNIKSLNNKKLKKIKSNSSYKFKKKSKNNQNINYILNKKSILGFNNNYINNNIPNYTNENNIQQEKQNLNFINNNNQINHNFKNYINNNNVNTLFNYDQNLHINNKTNTINSKLFFRNEYPKNLNLYYKKNIKFNNIDESKNKENENYIINNKINDKYSFNNYRPQIYESKTSSIIIDGIEYTTLLVPKYYVEKIKEIIMKE